MTNTDDIKSFYNRFFSDKKNYGVNDRIYGLYEKMKRLIRPGNTVLELGCGRGVFTYLLAKIVTRGSITAVDISPQSVQSARQRLSNKSSIEFIEADIVNFLDTRTYDFIILFDVLEHIPITQHRQLFANISKMCHDKTSILVHIPSPVFLDYSIKNNKDQLQIIDQPVYLETLLPDITAGGLRLKQLETRSIWDKDDYQFMIIEPATGFTKQPLSKERGLLEKILHRIKHIKIRMLHRY